ncbi:hypothetical protein BJX68DRAFT_101838 [Aspergillus pseudodeflectus]|uniref:Uncharacterized protein n=1 Tax=Aspergillus pseudodeflectus TaxID=176178 RepID=A0ABR4K8R4_9EURO
MEKGSSNRGQQRNEIWANIDEELAQNARPPLRLISGFLTTLPPPPPPPLGVLDPLLLSADDAVTPPIFLAAAAGLRTTDDLPPTSTSFLRLEDSVFSFSRCFSAAARSRSAAIWDSISMRRLNSNSVTRRSRCE